MPHVLMMALIVLLSLSACAGAGSPAPSPDVVPDTDAVQPLSVAPTASFTPVATSTATPLPSATFTASPTSTAGPTQTLDPTAQAAQELPLITAEPVFLTDLPMPVRMVFPEGWAVEAQNAALPIDDQGIMALLPFAAYSGPVTGGTGYIVVLWGFDSVMPAPPIEGFATPEADLWADGYRLLITQVLQPDCNVGRDPQQMYRVGPREDAVGGAFWAVGCGSFSDTDDIPEAPDVQGWFAAFQERGINFVFYAYVEPREAAGGPALPELQAILDTVQIDLSVLAVPTATPEF